MTTASTTMRRAGIWAMSRSHWCARPNSARNCCRDCWSPRLCRPARRHCHRRRDVDRHHLRHRRHRRHRAIVRLDRSSAVEPASVFAAARTCWSAVSVARRRTSRRAANARARLAAPDKHRSVRAIRAATLIRSIRIPAAPRRAAKTASSSTANASRKRRNARPVRRTRNAAPAMC